MIKNLFTKVARRVENLRNNFDPAYRIFGFKATYCHDRLISCHSTHWMNEEKFAQAYELAEQTGSWTRGNSTAKPIWRTHIICWAAYMAKDLEGDFVECGVNLGGFSRAVMHYIDFEKRAKTFYLLDTFCGVPDEQLTSEEKFLGGGVKIYSECYERACQNFKDYPNAKLIRGMVPDTLDQVPSQKIAYLSIDMNCAIPEIAAGEFFWDKLVPGAVVVLDDYGWAAHAHGRKCWDDFAKRKNTKVLALPTG